MSQNLISNTHVTTKIEVRHLMELEIDHLQKINNVFY